MANYWDGMKGGKHNSDDSIASFTPKKKAAEKIDNQQGNGVLPCVIRF